MNEIDNIWNSMLNQEEKLLDFDTFFIGDGANALMNRVRPISIKKNFQLSGISNITDLLLEHEDISELELENDIDEFQGQPISTEETPEDFFFSIKKSVFDHYQYLDIKAQKFIGKPIREKDLVLTVDDHYVLAALSNKSDYSAIRALAQLSAYLEMGFEEVRFNSLEDCALCQANNGNIDSINHLYSLLVNNGTLIHKNCLCDFIPVIRLRNKYRGLINITKDLTNVDGKKLINVPLEYYFDILDLVSFIDVEEIDTIEFTDFTKKNFDCLVVKEKKVLYVHCNYVGNYSPYDFLMKWVNNIDAGINVDELIEEKVNQKDIYIFNGKKVVEINGKYFDIATKKEVQ